METNETTEHIEQNNENDNNSKLRDYKRVCAELGLSMCVYFVCRLLAGGASFLLKDTVAILGETGHNLINSLMIIIMVYIIPLLAAALIFKSFANYKGKYRELYKKPKRLARALGTFPASFGLGQGVALLTLLISFLLSRYFGGQTYIEDLLRPTVLEPPTDLVSVLTMVFLLVVIAPVFEEFLCRGIMYDALKPYGTGIAIIISALLFGLMHGSLYMLFYTTAYGLVLGYLRYATGSLFTVTVIHAIVNSIAAGALLLLYLVNMTNEENKLINSIYFIYLVAVLVMIIVGIVVFLSKIPAIRKYRIENAWSEISPWKKTALFFVSIPVILMLVLAFNEISGDLLQGLLFS